VGGGLSQPAFTETVLEVTHVIQRAAILDEVTQNNFFCLARVETRLIGLKLLRVEYSGLFGFLMTMTLESFQLQGKKESKRQALRILKRSGFITGRLQRRRSAEIPS
jgi:hypothetical protein